tara:strand:+ start:104 stop:445 length:342 start_codon:yes stop_codon:yes gene_type:complete
MFMLFNQMMLKPKPLQQLKPLSDEQWNLLAQSPDVLYRGKLQFQLRCYKCHGFNGEGNWKGPSLIDQEWDYGDSYNAIYANNYYGVGEMKGYGKKLNLYDLQAVTVYLKSLSE